MSENPFLVRFKQLVARGAIPADKSGRKASATIIVQGFRGYQMLLAQAAQLLVVGVLVALLVPPSAFRHLRASKMAILDRLDETGLDVSNLTTADFFARLRYTPEEGQSLLSMSRIMPREQQMALVGWLRNSPNPNIALHDLMELVGATAYSSAKWSLVFGLTRVDEKSALALVGSVDIVEIVDKVAALSLDERLLIVQTGFPMVPKDPPRAALITAILSPNYPADIVAMTEALKNARPDRVDAVRNYLRVGAPLAACKPVACAQQPPAACFLSGYQCPSGSYATIATLQCVPYPPGTVFAK